MHRLETAWRAWWPEVVGFITPFLLWGLMALLALLAEVAFAATNTVRSYASKDACCQDLAIEASGGSGAAYQETYKDEIAYHVRSNLSHYSLVSCPASK